MKATRFTLTTLAIFALLFTYGSLAQAQATRTWVSGVGDDANPCSRTAPCKTFAGAISKTAAGGEINVLDPGGFGVVTITKSITILAQGSIGGVLFAGTNGVIVNTPASTDVVVLKGLDFEGVNTGLNAIRFIGQGTLVVEDCIFRNATQKAIDFEPSAASQLMVNNSTIANFNNSVNGGGIFIKGVGGATTKVIIDGARIERSLFGVQAQNGATVVIRNSTASANGIGYQAVSVAGGALDVSIDNSVASGNTTSGIRSEGSAAAIVRISRNVITSNALGLQPLTGGQIISYGNNQNTGNAANNNGAPTTTLVPGTT